MSCDQGRTPCGRGVLGRMHLRLAQASAALAAGALLTLSGPAAAGTDGWTRGGPWGGEISALAADPGAAGVVYAGAGRALFRSPDGGASWERTATFSDVPLTVAVDRDHVIYAGVSYAGIRRSVDGGANWQPVGTGLPTSFRYAIGPSADGRVLYAGTIEHGVWRIGADGGSWTPANGGAAGASIAQLSVDQRSSDRLAARTVDGQVLRSADGGATWSPVLSGATDLLRPADDPGSLLAAREGSLAVSDDGGETWSEQSPVGTWLAEGPSGTIHALDGAGTIRVSIDGGRSWTISGATGLTPLDGSPQAFAAAPALLVGTEVDLYRSADEGTSFAPGDTGIDLRFVNAVAVHPRAPARMLAATSAAYRTTDGGATWTRAAETSTGGTLGAVAYEPDNPRDAYAAADETAYRSSDGGRSWAQLPSAPPTSPTSLAVDPAQPSVVIETGTGDGVFTEGGTWRSDDEGQTWTQIGTGDTAAAAIDTDALHTVYTLVGGELRRLGDGRDSWAAASAGLAGPVAAFALDPSTTGRLYAVAGGRLHVSADGGDSWQPLPEPPFAPIEVTADPGTGDPVIAAGIRRVSRLTGGEWVDLGAGLPRAGGLRSVSVGADGSVHLATVRGVYDRSFGPPRPQVTTPAQPGFAVGAGAQVTVPVVAEWTLDGAQSCATTVEQWVDGAPAGPLAVAPGASSLRLDLARDGSSHQLRVRGAGCDGVTGAWGWGSPFTLAAMQESAAALDYRGDWTRDPDANADGGATRFAVAAGARATLSFTGRAVAWEAPRRPGSGSARVAIDGQYVATVDLQAGAVQPQRLMFARSWATTGSHRISVTVEGTAGHPRVDLDAFLILR